jgi:hypothetical protein
VNLGAVVARNPYLIVAQKKDNTWMWPPVPGAGGEDATKTKNGGGRDSEKAASTGGIRVQSFVTSGSGRIVYIDRATEPAFQLVLDPFVAAVESLDTRLPDSVYHFRAKGAYAQFGGVNLNGELTKRVNGFDLGLTVSVKGADLPDFNPYVAKREAIAVTAGRGDTQTTIAIENHVMSGKADVLLSGLEVTSTIGGKAFELIDPANFPICTALALLKDQRGNIKLDIPLGGRTSDPRFDFIDDLRAHFVRTVTTAGKVAADLPGKTLDRALQLLEGTISLLPGIDAELYAPVEFAYGEDELAAYPLIYLDQLGRRMRKHKSLVLALCGRSVAGDDVRAEGKPLSLDALFGKARAGVYPLPVPGREGQLALAEARAQLVRRYLGEVHKISAARLPSCDVLIDETDGAKPRVDLQVKTPARSKGLFGIFP